MDSHQDGSIRRIVASNEIDQAADMLPPADLDVTPSCPHDSKVVNLRRTCAKDAIRHAQPAKSPNQIVNTEFEALPDGSFLELVKVRATFPAVQLLHWSPSGSAITDSPHFRGKTFAPPQLSPALVRAVRMPTGAMPSGNARFMFNRISEFVQTFIDLSDEMLVRVVAYVLATWFLESLPVAPLLWITGPPTSGKTTLLRLLHGLCRRPILLTDMTPAAIYSLPSLLNPTLLVDECELGRSRADQHLIRLIRAGSTPGMHVVRNGQLFDLFCPKAVASRMWPDDDAVASRAIFVAMLPTQRVLPAFDPELIREEIDARQAELLDFRMRNFLLVKSPQLASASNLNPRTLQIARSLAAPFKNDEVLEQRLMSSLQQQDQDVDAVRYEQPEWIVVEALFRLAHERPVGELFVQTITYEVNMILTERDDDRRFKARRVGSILRSLGLKTERLGSWGRGIPISPQYLQEVHRLAQTFGFTRRHTTNWQAVKNGYGGLPCELCARFGLNAQLRCVPMPPLKRHRRLFDHPDRRAKPMDGELNQRLLVLKATLARLPAP